MIVKWSPFDGGAFQTDGGNEMHRCATNTVDSLPTKWIVDVVDPGADGTLSVVVIDSAQWLPLTHTHTHSPYSMAALSAIAPNPHPIPNGLNTMP